MTHLPQKKFSPLSCLTPEKGKYCRHEQLPALLKLWPRELDDYSYLGTLRIAALLRKALRAERRRARTGHWSYDLNRHLALIEALRHERARLRVLERALPYRPVAGKPAGVSGRPSGTLHLPGAGRVFQIECKSHSFNGMEA